MDDGTAKRSRGRGRGSKPRGRGRGRGGRGRGRKATRIESDEDVTKDEGEESDVGHIDVKPASPQPVEPPPVEEKENENVVPQQPPPIDMEADISQLEAPTFTTISRGPPEPMVRLKWDHKVSLIGEKVLNPMIHCCDLCEKPILIYGRMIPCKHVFCLKCAREEPLKSCTRCKEKVLRVEKSGLGTVFMCFHGGSRYGNTGCRRTYLSQRDLQAHINHRHVSPLMANAENKLSANEPKSAPQRKMSSDQHLSRQSGNSSSNRQSFASPISSGSHAPTSGNNSNSGGGGNQSGSNSGGNTTGSGSSGSGRANLISIPMQDPQQQSMISQMTGLSVHQQANLQAVQSSIEMYNTYSQQQQNQQHFGGSNFMGGSQLSVSAQMAGIASQNTSTMLQQPSQTNSSAAMQMLMAQQQQAAVAAQMAHGHPPPPLPMSAGVQNTAYYGQYVQPYGQIMAPGHYQTQQQQNQQQNQQQQQQQQQQWNQQQYYR